MPYFGPHRPLAGPWVKRLGRRERAGHCDPKDFLHSFSAAGTQFATILRQPLREQSSHPPQKPWRLHLGAARAETEKRQFSDFTGPANGRGACNERADRVCRDRYHARHVRNRERHPSRRVGGASFRVLIGELENRGPNDFQLACFILLQRFCSTVAKSHTANPSCGYFCLLYTCGDNRTVVLASGLLQSRVREPQRKRRAR